MARPKLSDVFFFITGDRARDSTIAFHREWHSLDDAAKNQLLDGLGDGSLNY